MKPRLKSWAVACCVALAAAATTSAMADGAKDIVLDRVTPNLTPPRTPAGPDAMAVSVLLESLDGSLMPRGTHTLFHTGDRFRVKVLTSRNGRLSLYNTNPLGETNPTPVWQGDVRFGLETISPRLALTGTSGVDQLHVVFEPPQEPGILAWLGHWLRGSKEGQDSGAKDIRLDVNDSPNASYFLSRGEPGLVATISIAHTR